MAKKPGKIKIRGVKVRLANKATPVTAKLLNIVLWDLENNRIPVRYARSVADQINAFLKQHGYNGEVIIESFSAMRGNVKQRVPEAVITEFNKPGSGVDHVRVESEDKQAADEAIKKRIDELIAEFDLDGTAGVGVNFVIVSSDAGFETYFTKLKAKGFHTFMVYDKDSIDGGYLQSVSASCKCIFKEFAALPKSKPKPTQ